MTALSPSLQHEKRSLENDIQRLTSSIEATHGVEKVTKLKKDIRDLCNVALRSGSETALTQLGEAAVTQAVDILNITGSALGEVRKLTNVILQLVEIESRVSVTDSEEALAEGNGDAAEHSASA